MAEKCRSKRSFAGKIIKPIGNISKKWSFAQQRNQDVLSETPGINFTRTKMDLTSKKHGVLMGFDVCVAL